MSESGTNDWPTDWPTLRGRRVALCVTGGIAAFRAVDLCSRLKKAGGQVRVSMTPAATKFVAPLTFEALSGRPAVTDIFDSPRAWEMDHIADARWAELVVIAPATADILAKLAHGLADCPVSALCLASTEPLLVAPAMNSAMWNHPATQRNVSILRQRGVNFVDPAEGRLACGEVGPGRLAEVDDILLAIESLLSPDHSLHGKSIVVTAGPTREFLDPARFISNPSSGRMGYALAEEALRRGARVMLISGPSPLTPPDGVEFHPVVSAAEMLEAARRALPGCDLAIFAAAPADFRPKAASCEKSPKSAFGFSLALEPTEDIAAWAGENRKEGQTLVGFAAETHDGERRAKEKMAAKNLDLIVLNDITRPDAGFESEDNEVLILARDGRTQLVEKQSKIAVAKAIFDFIR